MSSMNSMNLHPTSPFPTLCWPNEYCPQHDGLCYTWDQSALLVRFKGRFWYLPGEQAAFACVRARCDSAEASFRYVLVEVQPDELVEMPCACASGLQVNPYGVDLVAD